MKMLDQKQISNYSRLIKEMQILSIFSNKDIHRISKEIKMNNNSLSMLKRLGYVIEVGDNKFRFKGGLSNEFYYTLPSILMNEYRRYMTEWNKFKKEKPIKFISDTSSFTDSQLINELKIRGYLISKVITKTIEEVVNY